MFALLVLMCFGDKLDEKQIKLVEYVQRRQLLSFGRFNILNLWPKFTKLIQRKKWEEFFQIRKEQLDVLLPLIRARRKIVEERKQRSAKEEEDNREYVQSYVDTLLDLELRDEKRKLNEDKIVSLCSEFLNGGTDTTATTLQWIMANLVKNPEIQERLYEEIKTVVREEANVVEVASPRIFFGSGSRRFSFILAPALVGNPYRLLLRFMDEEELDDIFNFGRELI